jgi:threonine dehydratase
MPALVASRGSIYDLVSEDVDDLVLVTDAERDETLRVLYNDLAIAAGPFGASGEAGLF